MVKSKLSDQEIDTLVTLVLYGEPNKVTTYVNQLLYQRGLKDDGCFFPIAFRKENGCFAKECMGKIISFIEELNKRKDKKTIDKTLNYIRSLCDQSKPTKL